MPIHIGVFKAILYGRQSSECEICKSEMTNASYPSSLRSRFVCANRFTNVQFSMTSTPIAMNGDHKSKYNRDFRCIWLTHIHIHMHSYGPIRVCTYSVCVYVESWPVSHSPKLELILFVWCGWFVGGTQSHTRRGQTTRLHRTRQWSYAIGNLRAFHFAKVC